MSEYNPFKEETIEIMFRTGTLRGLLIDYCGLDAANGYVEKVKDFGKYPIEEREMNFNPTCFGKILQRDLVWSLEDKQALIKSVYDNVFIGNFIIHRLDVIKLVGKYMAHVEDSDAEMLTAYMHEIIDGKQRLSTLISFCRNEFADHNGKYYRDLSEFAIRKFKNFSKLGVCELKDLSDADKKAIFLNVNTTGVSMDKSHLEYVEKLSEKESNKSLDDVLVELKEILDDADKADLKKTKKV